MATKDKSKGSTSRAAPQSSKSGSATKISKPRQRKAKAVPAKTKPASKLRSKQEEEDADAFEVMEKVPGLKDVVVQGAASARSYYNLHQRGSDPIHGAKRSLWESAWGGRIQDPDDAPAHMLPAHILPLGYTRYLPVESSVMMLLLAQCLSWLLPAFFYQLDDVSCANASAANYPTIFHYIDPNTGYPRSCYFCLQTAAAFCEAIEPAASVDFPSVPLEAFKLLEVPPPPPPSTPTSPILPSRTPASRQTNLPPDPTVTTLFNTAASSTSYPGPISFNGRFQHECSGDSPPVIKRVDSVTEPAMPVTAREEGQSLEGALTARTRSFRVGDKRVRMEEVEDEQAPGKTFKRLSLGDSRTGSEPAPWSSIRGFSTPSPVIPPHTAAATADKPSRGTSPSDLLSPSFILLEKQPPLAMAAYQTTAGLEAVSSALAPFMSKPAPSTLSSLASTLKRPKRVEKPRMAGGGPSASRDTAVLAPAAAAVQHSNAASTLVEFSFPPSPLEAEIHPLVPLRSAPVASLELATDALSAADSSCINLFENTQNRNTPTKITSPAHPSLQVKILLPAHHGLRQPPKRASSRLARGKMEEEVKDVPTVPRSRKRKAGAGPLSAANERDGVDSADEPESETGRPKRRTRLPPRFREEAST